MESLTIWPEEMRIIKNNLNYSQNCIRHASQKVTIQKDIKPSHLINI